MSNNITHRKVLTEPDGVDATVVRPQVDWNNGHSVNLTNGSIPFITSNDLDQDNTNLFWDKANVRLGVGTSTPAHPLDVLITSTTTATIHGTQSRVFSQHTSGSRPEATGLYANAYNAGTASVFGDSALISGVYGYAQTDGGVITVIEGVAGNTLVTGGTVTNNSAYAGIMNVTGGVVTHEAVFKSEGAKVNGGTVTNLYGAYLTSNVVGSGTATNNYGLKIDNQAGIGTNNWSILTGTGTVSFGDRVGIGTVAPGSLLEVAGTTATAGIFDNSGIGANKGGELLLQHVNVTPARTTYASVKAGALNGAAGAEDGYLVLKSMRAGTLTEGVRLDSTGKVGIGTATPVSLLHLLSGNNIGTPDLSFSFSSNGDYRNGISNTFSNSVPANNILSILVGNATTTGQVSVASFQGDGTVNIPGLTASQLVQTDGSKNLVSSNTLPLGALSQTTIDSASLTAVVGSTLLYTPTASGMYRISYYAKIITAASVSSILGGTAGLVLTYTDGTDSVAQTAFTLPEFNQAGTALSIGTGNTTNTTQAVNHGSAVIFAKTGVAINYTYGYSSTGTAMAYELHIKVEAL